MGSRTVLGNLLIPLQRRNTPERRPSRNGAQKQPAPRRSTRTGLGSSGRRQRWEPGFRGVLRGDEVDFRPGQWGMLLLFPQIPLATSYNWAEMQDVWVQNIRIEGLKKLGLRRCTADTTGLARTGVESAPRPGQSRIDGSTTAVRARGRRRRRHAGSEGWVRLVHEPG